LQFGERLPKKGLYFAMGTHSQYPEPGLFTEIGEIGCVRLKSL
jgi:hypothetical protein